MDTQTLTMVATVAGPSMPVLLALASWLKKLTLHSRAKGQIQWAGDLRSIRASRSAEFHERRARELLLRPSVMSDRAILGPLAWADIGAIVLIVPGAVLTLAAGDSLPVFLLALPFLLSGVGWVLHDSRAVDRKCEELAAEPEDLDPPAPRTTLGPPVAAWALVFLVAARMSRR